MATSATPSEIVAGSVCFDCVPDKMAALLYIFNQIRVIQGGSAMTPQEIASASACFTCVPNGMQWTALLYLANAIVDNGASDFTYTRSAVDPVAAPPTANAQHYNTVSQVLWQWDGAAWV